MAYPIEQKSTGFYNLIEFKAEPPTIDVLELEYRRDEKVMRFLTTALDKHAVEYNVKRRKGEFNKKEEPKKRRLQNDITKRTYQQGPDQKRKKYCRFRKNGIKYIDYKDANFLLKFVNEQGKILPRRITGTSVKFQKKVAQAVKRARHIGLLPYVTDSLK